MHKNCFEFYFVLNTKINSKSIVCTNVKLKTIRLLEERIRESNHNFGLGKEILDRPQKAQSMKEKERLVRLLNYTIKLQFKHQLKKVNCILNFLIYFFGLFLELE